MYQVKCDECKATIRETQSVRESAAGGLCKQCAAKSLEKWADQFDVGEPVSVKHQEGHGWDRWAAKHAGIDDDHDQSMNG